MRTTCLFFKFAKGGHHLEGLDSKLHFSWTLAGWSQVVQRVGSGRGEPLVVPEEAVAAEPPLGEAAAGEVATPTAHPRIWTRRNAGAIVGAGAGAGRLLRRCWNDVAQKRDSPEHERDEGYQHEDLEALHLACVSSLYRNRTTLRELDYYHRTPKVVASPREGMQCR